MAPGTTLSVVVLLCISLLGGLVATQNAPGEAIGIRIQDQNSTAEPAYVSVSSPSVRTGLLGQSSTSSRESYAVKSLKNITDNADVMKLLNGIYAGQVPIKADGSSLFFTYFPAPASASSNDLVIWLNGGPGCSSMFGLMAESGPLRIQPDATFQPNPFSWQQKANMLFIEQPVGVGFSTVGSSASAVYNISGVGGDMYLFLNKFYDIFNETQSMSLYITGESFAGKYIPTIAENYVFKNNLTLTNGKPINLKGIAIGNGVLDDAQQALLDGSVSVSSLINEADFWRDTIKQTGIVSAESLTILDQLLSQCIPYINKQGGSINLIQQYTCNFYTFVLRRKVLEQNKSPDDACMDYYNVLKPCSNLVAEQAAIEHFFSDADVRSSLHVSTATQKWAQCNDPIFNRWNDTGIPGSEKIYPRLLSRSDLRVIIFQGIQDDVVNHFYVERGLGNMTWNNAQGFTGNIASGANNWTVNGAVAGTTLFERNLRYYRVYGAGHFVPTDVPRSALSILQTLLGRSSEPDWGTVNVTTSAPKSGAVGAQVSSRSALMAAFIALLMFALL
ncbi:Alpha/Beta hydrolase protein [Cladochytrium replicatum]|nr:Alpha/Beta hydrolase protein [Cladochytrium replicatum]